jgi:hypothetical protein
MERVSDKSKKHEDNNLIKIISQILSEIINENKAELKGKESISNINLTR